MKIYVFILCLLIVVPLKAQEIQVWDLKNCIQYALTHNLDLKQNSLRVQQATLNVKESKWQKTPSIGANINGDFNAGRSIDPNTNSYIHHQFFNNYADVSLNWTLFQAMKVQHQIRFEKFQQTAESYALADTQNKLIFDLMQAFYDVAYYDELWDITKAQIELSEKMEAKGKLQEEVGLKAQADIVEITVQLEKEKLLSIQAYNQMMDAKSVLANYMNYNESLEEWYLNVEILEPFLHDFGTTQSLFESYQHIAPEIQSKQFYLSASIADLKSTKASYMPEIKAYASMNTGYFQTNTDEQGNKIPFLQQWNNNLNQSVGVGMYIPIFNQNTLGIQVQKAKLRQLEAETALQKVKAETARLIENDVRAFQSAKVQVKQAQKLCEANKLAYWVASEKYEEGLIDIFDLLTSKQAFGQAKLDLLLANLQAQLKQNLLLFYQGKRFY